MRILDRERYWAFIKAYLICFVALVGLYVVIDAFTNLDEFTKIAVTPIELFRVMGRFYAIRTIAFYDRLCGVITMMAAIFTVTWMQRNNELLAILSAGVSTQRVIRPVWIAAIVVSLLTVANQEILMPRFGEELQRDHDDVGIRTVGVYCRYDANSIMLQGGSADRRSSTIFPFNVSLSLSGEVKEIDALQAKFVSPQSRRYPMHGGWLLHKARISPPLTRDEAKSIANVLIPIPDQDLAKFPKPLVFRTKATNPEPIPELEDPSVYAIDPKLDILNAIQHIKLVPTRRTYFLKSNLSFASLTQRTDWHMFATTPSLFRALADSDNDSSQPEIAVALHTRLMRPLLTLTLMFLSLPQVLGGFGRNMFINLGLSLGTSALFYGISYMTSFLGSNGAFAPELAVWIPLIGFGTLAAARWGTIRT